MFDTKLIKAVCKRTNKHYGIEVAKVGGVWKIVNVIEMSDKEAKMVASEVKVDSITTNSNLLPCGKCGSRVFGGCSCIKNTTACSHDMPYNFQCIYCNEMKFDYSVPSKADLGGYKEGDKITLIQGKEMKIITFSNVSWTKFDNIQIHPTAPISYHEPKIHVIASETDIAFHGYNVSEMDEGVYYEIGEQDDFVINCDVDTSTISPHPGGYLYIKCGIITAQITKTGGTFYLGEVPVARVGARFNMTLSLTGCGKYAIAIDGQKKGEHFQRTSGKTRITFGFKHDSHYCELLSHASLKNINMAQGMED